MALLDTTHLNELVELLGKDTVHQICQDFIRDSQHKFSQLEQTWQENDLPTLGTLSHSLKSASANMALQSFSVEMAKLEKNASLGNLEAIQSQLSSLPALYQESIHSLEHYFA